MKTSKKYIAFLSAVAMIMAILLYFPSGIFSNMNFVMATKATTIEPSQPSKNGNDVYQIGTAEELYWFAQQVNDGSNSLNAVLTANITVNSNLFENLNDDGTVKANCTVENWTPIGKDEYNKDYNGIFDGQGHTVSGLYFNDTSTNNVGLFGYIGQNCNISNVGVVDSYFNGGNSIGGICGQNYSGIITNCYNTGKIRGSYIGGVCGINYSKIDKCYNNGEVIGSSSVGGVCGNNMGLGTVLNCYNTGSVSGTGENISSLLGFNDNGTIQNCYYLADSETDYINGTTHKTATEFSDGTVCTELKYHSHQNGICILCKNVENDIMIYGQSVTLDGTIGMNIYVAANDDYTGWRASFNGTNVATPDKDENGLYKFTYQVAAKDMENKIQFYINDRVNATVSVKEYADYILNKSNNYDETTKNMVSAMLNYCNAANKYFSKETVPTADSVTSDNFKDYKFTLDTTPDGISYYGSSLLLESETTVRHYFKLAEGKEIGNFTFTVKGNTVTPVEKQGYYYIDVKNISADKLGTPHTVKIGDTAVISNYSALSYAKNVLESETADDNLKNLVKSLYLYNQKALAYNSATQSEGN